MKKIKIDEIKQYMFVIKQLSSREIKRKYTRTYLGILWSVLNPLLTMIVMALIFTKMFNRTVDYFPLYLMAGQIIWQLFSNATSSSLSSLVDNKVLLTRVKQPKIIFPMSRVLTAGINFLYTLVAFIVLMIAFQVPLNITVVLVPIVIICVILFSLGIGYILSCLNGLFGDIKHLYSVLLVMWMYFSAIFYPISSLEEPVRGIVERNPVYNYITCFRNVMIYGQLPTQAEWLRMIGWAFGSYIIGRLVFHKLENKLMMHLW